MKNDSCIIIDGNNLVHRESGNGKTPSFVKDRQQLLARIGLASGLLADRVVIVFDGHPDESIRPSGGRPEVVFSCDLSADVTIARMVSSAPQAKSVTVVSSDRAVRDHAEASGASSLSCIGFLELLDERCRLASARLRSMKKEASRPTLGDIFPAV